MKITKDPATASINKASLKKKVGEIKQIQQYLDQPM